jgi:predicted nucleic acid-binding protein
VTGWLLDTNVLSELRRPEPEREVLAFIAAQPLDLLYVSAVTLAEIRFRIELVADAGGRADRTIGLRIGRVRCSNNASCRSARISGLEWRLLVEDGRKVGRGFSQPF